MLEQSLEETRKFQMKKEEQFIFIVYGNALNMAAYDIVKQSKIMTDALKSQSWRNSLQT